MPKEKEQVEEWEFIIELFLKLQRLIQEPLQLTLHETAVFVLATLRYNSAYFEEPLIIKSGSNFSTTSLERSLLLLIRFIRIRAESIPIS